MYYVHLYTVMDTGDVPSPFGPVPSPTPRSSTPPCPSLWHLPLLELLYMYYNNARSPSLLRWEQ